MAYWLIKSEPFKYSWDQFNKDKRTFWDGVRNYADVGKRAVKKTRTTFNSVKEGNKHGHGNSVYNQVGRLKIKRRKIYKKTAVYNVNHQSNKKQHVAPVAEFSAIKMLEPGKQNPDDDTV